MQPIANMNQGGLRQPKPRRAMLICADLLSGPQDALQDAAPTPHALGAPARRANSIAGEGAGAPSVVHPVDSL